MRGEVRTRNQLHEAEAAGIVVNDAGAGREVEGDVIMRGIFWPVAKHRRAMPRLARLFDAKRTRHAKMHDKEIRAVEIGDEIFRPAPEPVDAPAGEALGETLGKRKP